MKSTAFLTPIALIMIKIVQVASAERVNPQCGKCTNRYFAGNNTCYLWWSKAQCDSVDVYKGCGAGGNDPLPPPSSELVPPPSSELVPPPPSELVPPPPNELMPPPPNVPKPKPWRFCDGAGAWAFATQLPRAHHNG
ncbi:hypothetical protein DYB28_001523 [Aphanomyces astaci]|uniref:Uncharacterized protein n=1 Tax=Aphanomyces astaci TaxID=112090 RepID=A0A9X8E732_APHAT|nr:hypothetical protein DYB28_001523 [Aphanomyces astaci]